MQVDLRSRFVKIPGAYTDLSREAGLHEFVPAQPKQPVLVKVTVMPVDNHPEDKCTTVHFQSAKASGHGMLMDRFRSQTQARDRTHSISVEIKNGLSSQHSEEIANDLVVAEPWRHRVMENSNTMSDEGTDVVRRYRLSSGSVICDFRTSTSTSRLNGFWNGMFNDFFLRWLQYRQIEPCQTNLQGNDLKRPGGCRSAIR